MLGSWRSATVHLCRQAEPEALDSAKRGAPSAPTFVQEPLPDTSAVSLRDVAHRYGRRWAVRGVSLAVARGEVLAIIGHNGSGKSTLLRIVATALRATRGSGTVWGADLTRDAVAIRQMVSLLSTEPGVYGDLTALENLRFSAEMLGADSDRRILQGALERVGLGLEGNERARNMSSGMQRRLSIARLLLREPRVLLLDEPFNSLDHDGAALVNTLIRETRERGGSVLLVAHDISRATSRPDRTVEMNDGMLEDSIQDSEPATLAGMGR